VTTRARPAVTRAPLTEREWQAQVTDTLRLCGWIWIHVLNARATRQGAWRPPISGPLATGWPDLTIFRRGWCGVIELKREDGKVTPEQIAVLNALTREVDFVWVAPKCYGFEVT
jgi:hypothetical protein